MQYSEAYLNLKDSDKTTHIEFDDEDIDDLIEKYGFYDFVRTGNGGKQTHYLVLPANIKYIEWTS